MKDWVVVYRLPTYSSSRAEIIRGILSESGIEAVIVNKKDSMVHMSGGEIEVQVPRSKVLSAIKIINDEISFE